MESVNGGCFDVWKRWRKAAFIMIAGLLVCSGAYLFFLTPNKPLAPTALVVAPCKSSSSSMQRIQVGDSYSFFANQNEFVCREQMDDTPPFTKRFCVKPKRGVSALVFSLHDTENLRGAPPDPMHIFSEHSERRPVVDNKGSTIGQDSWGYWDREKYWRKVHLHGINAKYGLVTKSEAESYDRILSSACLSNP